MATCRWNNGRWKNSICGDLNSRYALDQTYKKQFKIVVGKKMRVFSYYELINDGECKGIFRVNGTWRNPKSNSKPLSYARLDQPR